MIFRVHVKPNARKNVITVKEDNELEICICATPVDGKANKYLVNYLSEIFEISKSSIVILKGLTNSYKIVEIIADEEHVKKILNKKNPK